MMKTKNRVSKKVLIICISILCLQFFCAAAETNWVIAAQKFTYSKGQIDNSVTNATASTVPADILEKLNKTLVRNVYPDEKLERARYKSRLERQSLYLQLTSEYKKRDSLLLNNYSDSKLKTAIAEEEKKINEIKNKIDANIQSLQKQEEQLEQDMINVQKGENVNPFEDSELKRISRLFKRIFVKDENILTNENISFYRNDNTALYNPTEELMEEGYTGYNFQKAVYSAGINALITGIITSYGDYISVEVSLYLYPGAKKVASVMEVGALSDLDYITSSLANQIVPYMTNSMPVEVNFAVSPSDAVNCDIFIDDVLQKTDGKKITMESGVHTIQFVKDGYKTAETSYFFEGNTKYNIDVNMVELQSGIVTFELKRPIEGNIVANGRLAQSLDESHTQIKINGNKILGDFIGENGETAFFYVPIDDYYDGSYVTINPKPFDRDKYIDTRRKWMYGSYSAFMVSLIPYFYTYGNLVNKAKLYNDGRISRDEAMQWQTANDICSGILIGCGIFWGYELVRYLLAANYVLPEKGKKQSKGK